MEIKLMTAGFSIDESLTLRYTRVSVLGDSYGSGLDLIGYNRILFMTQGVGIALHLLSVSHLSD